MAAKPELSAAQGIQNVVVYVSNDNFAQAYAVGQQNVAHSYPPPHSVAPMAGPPKCFVDKIKPPEYPNNGLVQHFPANAVISQNGFPVGDLSEYQNIDVLDQIKNVSYTNTVGGGERQSGPGRPHEQQLGKVREECDYLMGGEGQTSVRCDSVRSETAESSCSSLSSTEEGGLVVVPQGHDMVVYDGGVSVRHGGVVLTVGPGGGKPQAQPTAPIMGTIASAVQPQSIMVPFGWKRISSNGAIIYISPSNTALSSLDQVKEYLLTPGTCKCGLECPLKCDKVFSFDPKMPSRPWTLTPDTNTGDLTKLCNHKRKLLAMTSLGCTNQPDPSKLPKDIHLKKKKRKITGAYGGGGVPMSQMLTQRDAMGLMQQHHQQLQQQQPSQQTLFNKENQMNQGQLQQAQIWSNQPTSQNRLQTYVDNSHNPNQLQPQQQQFFRYQEQQQSQQQMNRVLTGGSPMVVGETMIVQPQTSSSNISQMQQQQSQHQQANHNSPSVHISHQQIIGPNGQVINIHGPTPVNAQGTMGSTAPAQQQHRIFINGPPNEPSGPGRPNIQMVPISVSSNRPEVPPPPRIQQQPFYNPQYQMRPQLSQIVNGFPIHQNQPIQGGHVIINHNQHQIPKVWNQSRMQVPMQQQQITTPPVHSSPNTQPQNAFERVPPLHQHTPPPNMWQDELNRKKVKMGKTMKKQRSYAIDAHGAPCPNIDVRQIHNDGNRMMVNQFNQQPTQSASSPSFLEDPSGYLAQQTALLNSTINRQTGANGCSNFSCGSPITSMPSPQQNSSHANGVPLPSNLIGSHVKPAHSFAAAVNRVNQNVHMVKQQSASVQQQHNQIVLPQEVADSASDHSHCQGCVVDSGQQQYQEGMQQYAQQKLFQTNRPDSQPGTPSSSGTGEDPVTSSTYGDKSNHSSPDSRPIQGGTVSTSNVSPQEEANDPNQNRNQEQQQQQQQFVFHPQQQIRDVAASPYHSHQQQKHDGYCPHPHNIDVQIAKISNVNPTGVVTTMASGRTVGSNTITSVLAGRANTATVSINAPSTVNIANNPQIPIAHNFIPTAVNVSKSPLEMVQSVVSSIQVPHSQIGQQPQQQQHHHHQQQQVLKAPPPSQNLPPGHILVSSGGQLIMANTGSSQHGVMAPPPPKIVTNQGQPMPPISVSPMITNVTAAVTQVIPAVAAQQVLGQQTVLVNALPTPFVIQPGVTMTMDGMTVGQNMQIPHLVAGNVIQQQIQLDNSDPRRAPALLSPDTKRKGKKRKMPSQTVASMLHIAATQQNSGVVMSQQGFPQQIQMAHSPQSINTQPVMQALTIVPGKAGAPPQIVMNGQPGHLGAQQLITNSQPTQQINLLQPVNLLNGGMVQNFPTIQQFIVPNLGGMVMNADGTATLLQDTSNLGMQLQLQNVNGQNVLTPVQNNNVFNGGQSILTAGPAGMVIRGPGTSQGKIIQQQHSPGAQFLSPNGGQFVVNGAQFSGQLSPLVANVSPSQQVTFGTAPQQAMRPAQPQGQQEYIQCGQMGQTLMVPCTLSGNIAVSSSNQQQNTTFVQQNTTIVQQQTTMVSNNQQLQNFQNNQQGNQQQQNIARTATLNLDHQNFIIASNENKQQPVQALVLQRQSPPNSANYRQSVSTQTAVNQSAQSVTTNTFCQTSTSTASSPPDTTTHSPLASGGQSPPTADTTTHTGSTDDGLSPAPSNCSGTCGDIMNMNPQQQSCSMAMVHCISSSEPDSAEMNSISAEMSDWSRGVSNIPQAQMNCSVPKMEFTDVSSVSTQMGGKKPSSQPIHVAYAESSTLVSGMHFASDQQMKSQQEGVVASSRAYEKIANAVTAPKRKHSDALVVMGLRHVYEDDEEGVKSTGPKSPRDFIEGDLVWGPAKGCPAWPGKVVTPRSANGKIAVQWFGGGDKTQTEVDPCQLQTLSEGLDAHHRARKKSRTSRKLNAQLENAIQEAMAELDKVPDSEDTKRVRLRSGSQR